jgi:hypothetical protein
VPRSVIESSNARVGVKVIAAADSDMFTGRMTQAGEVTSKFLGPDGSMARPGKADPARSSAPIAHRTIAAILLCIAVISAPRPTRAAAFEVNDTGWEGSSELLEIARGELGAARVQAVAVLNWDEVQPEDGVLAIHPLQPMDAEETTGFMKAGGRLAILDDYGLGEETLRRFHIERTVAPSRPVVALRNRSALAIADPVIDVVAGHSQGPHPVVAKVQQLVTNHPTGLRHPNLSPVLRIRAIGEPDAIIAVAGQVGKGRLFAMSDPSATINQMLRYPGNRAFVAGLARYLVDDDGQQRRQGRLFIVVNRFSEEGSFGGQTSLRKDIESQLKAIANALAEARRDGFPGWTLVVLAVLAALGIAAWVLRASAKPYKSPLPRYARAVPLVAQGGIAGRFAVIAAPSSPRSLALLELKSALYEALAVKLDLAFEPAPEGLAKIAQNAGSLDESSYSALKDVLALMQQTEASVVAGRPAPVSRAALSRAAGVVRSVLRACGADGAGLAVPSAARVPAASLTPPPEGPPPGGSSESPKQPGESAA